MVETLQQKARRMMASQCADGCKDCPSNAICLLRSIVKTPNIEEKIDRINKWAIENPIRSYYVVNEDRRNQPGTCDGQCTLCWSSQYTERCVYYVNGKCWGTREQETCYSDGKLEMAHCVRASIRE